MDLIRNNDGLKTSKYSIGVTPYFVFGKTAGAFKVFNINLGMGDIYGRCAIRAVEFLITKLSGNCT